MFATLATGIFRNSPWHLGQGNLLTILLLQTIWLVQCLVNWDIPVLWQSPKSKNWSNSDTGLQSYEWRVMYYSRTPIIRPPSESHWCGRIRGMVAREGFVYKQKPLSVTRNVVVWEGWSLVRVVVRQGFYCTMYVHVQCTSTSQCYLKMESQRIEFTFEEHPLLNMGTQYRRHNKLN